MDAFWQVALEERSSDEIGRFERRQLAPDSEEGKYRKINEGARRKEIRIKIQGLEIKVYPTLISDDGLFGATGGELWLASEVFGHVLLREKKEYSRILEVGAGLGLAGLVAASHWPDAHVILTDFDSCVVDNLRSTITANRLDHNTEAFELDITASRLPVPIELMIASELVYTPHLARGLAKSILLNPINKTLLLQRLDRPGFLDTFLPMLRDDSFCLSLYKVTIVSEYTFRLDFAGSDISSFLHYASSSASVLPRPCTSDEKSDRVPALFRCATPLFRRHFFSSSSRSTALHVDDDSGYIFCEITRKKPIR